jgi:hypothetical protein
MQPVFGVFTDHFITLVDENNSQRLKKGRVKRIFISQGCF